MAAAANSKLCAFNQSLTAAGNSLYDPKYQKNTCTKSGVLRKNSTYAPAPARTTRTGDSRKIATSTPSRNAATIATAESCTVTFSPDSSQSKYFPDVTTAQSTLQF